MPRPGRSDASQGQLPADTRHAYQPANISVADSLTTVRRRIVKLSEPDPHQGLPG